MTAPLYQIPINTIEGTSTTLAPWEGKVLLIVNVASQCAFTPQYQGLEILHQKYSDQGFAVLGFPCNQFGAQEPGSETEIQTFCETAYGVKFPLFAKIDVNGDKTHPLYAYLKSQKKGLLGIGAIKWNFTKFLIGRHGKVIDRFAPQSKPEALTDDIERALST